GGNNDNSFYEPDLAITVLDPHRPGHELQYYPGEVCLRTTDVAIINKIGSADEKSTQIVEDNNKQAKPDSTIIKSESTITVDKPELIKNIRVLGVGDGPTLRHGEMEIGEGSIADECIGVKEIVNT